MNFWFFLSMTFACAPIQVSTTDTETEVQETDVTEDTSIEQLPPSETELVVTPLGSAFVEELTINISTKGIKRPIYTCTTTPSDNCKLEPYKNPININNSTILIVQIEGEDPQAFSYVKVDEKTMKFSSNIPIMLYWTDSTPDYSRIAGGINIFEPNNSNSSFLNYANYSGRAGIKIRGSSSSSMEKRPFDLELWQPTTDDDQKVEIMGLPEEADWVLYAPYYYDDALIRNSLGYQLSRDIGRYAPKTAAFELFVADFSKTLTMNSYQGVYILVEEIERGKNRVDITKLEPNDIKFPEVTGGYIFKRDRTGSGESGFWSGSANNTIYFECPLVMVDPEEDELHEEQQKYISDQTDELAWALVSENFTNPITGKHYSEIVDVDSFIDHHILNVLFKNPDSFRLSGYFYKDRESLINAGPIWDLDRTSGSIDSRASNPQHWDASNQTSDTTYVFTFGWYGPMFTDPDFTSKYWARFRELISGDLSREHTMATIDMLTDGLADPAARNSKKWHVASFDSEIGNLKSWFNARYDWIETCLELEDPQECSAHP